MFLSVDAYPLVNPSRSPIIPAFGTWGLIHLHYIKRKHEMLPQLFLYHETFIVRTLYPFVICSLTFFLLSRYLVNPSWFLLSYFTLLVSDPGLGSFGVTNFIVFRRILWLFRCSLKVLLFLLVQYLYFFFFLLPQNSSSCIRWLGLWRLWRLPVSFSSDLVV